MPFNTAEIVSKCDLVWLAIAIANVVFPVPGGPQRMMEENNRWLQSLAGVAALPRRCAFARRTRPACAGASARRAGLRFSCVLSGCGRRGSCGGFHHVRPRISLAGFGLFPLAATRRGANALNSWYYWTLQPLPHYKESPSLTKRGYKADCAQCARDTKVTKPQGAAHQPLGERSRKKSE